MRTTKRPVFGELLSPTIWIGMTLVCFLPSLGQAETQLGSSVQKADVPKIAVIVNENTLVGTTGTFFLRHGDEYTGKPLGGVAMKISAVFPGSADRWFAVGQSSPIFEIVDNVYTVHPLPSRGPVQVSASGEPLISIARNLYHLKEPGASSTQQAKKKASWKRVATTSSIITAITTTSTSRGKPGPVLLALKNGLVLQLRGRKKVPVTQLQEKYFSTLADTKLGIIGVTNENDIVLFRKAKTLTGGFTSPTPVSLSDGQNDTTPAKVIEWGDHVGMVFKSLDGLSAFLATVTPQSTLGPLVTLPTTSNVLAINGFSNGTILVAEETGQVWSKTQTEKSWQQVKVRTLTNAAAKRTKAAGPASSW